MDFGQIKELIEKIDASSLKIFELSNEAVSIKMSKNDTAAVSNEAPRPAEVVAPKPVSNASNATDTVSTVKEEVTPVSEDLEGVHEVTAPIVGTSYLASSPDKPAFVKAGDIIEKGQPLVIIEAMKVMNEIKSDVSGTVYKVLVEDGQPIEFGQPLVQIKDVK
ncbi:acetyl-CoA carboxylase biotin carboxyl carrier protein [Marinilactibacillus sp. Marseille-P9653]|uniref:acetyl-CoA carboxylase biotin carboxyl carrier protein n=1 Tax=Marinilactibacillus sp. Marseille-P9653 TaxID=2866583 RepID=UPI001CE4ABB9|nr:acetyl-CoA carboxylase biotin carboxyl carrier protein [Marinilactibacillus sp. Marseille-P9653]